MDGWMEGGREEAECRERGRERKRERYGGETDIERERARAHAGERARFTAENRNWHFSVCDPDGWTSQFELDRRNRGNIFRAVLLKIHSKFKILVLCSNTQKGMCKRKDI